MKSLFRKTFFFLALALYGCGTGPWYIQKSLYNVYKEPIYQNSEINLKTNGFYAQLSDSEIIDYSKNILVFNNKGYSISMNYDTLQNLIKRKKTIEADFDWWKIENDSITIENYGETKRLMMTMVYWHKGKIINDSTFTLKLANHDDQYSKTKVLKYKFIATDTMPELKNKARYFTKKWYLENLNEIRK